MEVVTSEDKEAVKSINVSEPQTYHRAGSKSSDGTKRAMTIIILEGGDRLTVSKKYEQEADRTAFIPGREPGEKVDTFMNPLLFS